MQMYRATPPECLTSYCVRHPILDFPPGIEDVYLGEDGSITRLITWKPSLIAMENLVGEQLQRGREGLRGKRCDHQEVQRRSV